MLDWDLYRFILALHRTGTIRGAASELGVNHATVSRRMRQFNADTPSPIFERVAGKYVVTRQGEPLVSAAERIEVVALHAERRQRALGETLSGKITLSMAETIGQYLLRDELIAFAQTYPNIELTVSAEYRRVDLDRSEADVVIRGDDTPPEHLVGTRMFPYGLSYYAHKAYLATTPPAQRRWLSFSQSSTPLEWLPRSPYPQAPVQLRVGDLTLLQQMAEAGQGMIYTACFIGDPNPNLTRLSKDPPTRGLDFWVLTHPDLRKSPRIKALMGALTQALTKKRALIEGWATEDMLN